MYVFPCGGYYICAIEIVALIHNNSFYWEVISTWCMLYNSYMQLFFFSAMGNFQYSVLEWLVHVICFCSMYWSYVSVAE